MKHRWKGSLECKPHLADISDTPISFMQASSGEAHARTPHHESNIRMGSQLHERVSRRSGLLSDPRRPPSAI
jgi:hypothetical protein